MRGTRDVRSEHSHRDGESGFSLLELLIVIIVLGILGGIAMLTIRPFERASVEACFDVEFMNVDVVAAAERAGIDLGDLDLSESVECIPIALLFANAVENPNAVVTMSQQARPGQTMVAISAHRSGTANPTPVICSGDQYLAPGTTSNPSCQSTTPGWQLHDVRNVGSGQSGRGIAVWTKLPEPNEPTVVRANWRHPDGTWWNASKSLIVGVFSRPLTMTGLAFNDSGTGSMVTALDLGSATGAAGPAAVVASLATRDTTSGGGPCAVGFDCVTFSGVPGMRKANHFQASSVFNAMAWAPVRSGQGPYQATATWDVARHAVGFTMVLNLFVDP